MAKTRTMYECTSCGHTEPKWLGRCPACGTWNSFIQSTAEGSSPGKKTPGKKASPLVPLASITTAENPRISTGMAELDRTLGGGIVPGSSVLIGGEPGIGKSTLMIQLACGFRRDAPVLYISGEESAHQVKARADRLGISGGSVDIFCETDIDAIQKALDKRNPLMVIVDSIQTLRSEELGTVAGTVNQIKYCTHELISWVRERGSAVFLVAHVTKEGTIAGPKVVEHMVDTVLYFEQTGSEIRLIRSAKNRFGSIDEIGLFTMNETGLHQVTDPSALFTVQRDGPLPPGITVAAVYEGSRSLLVEIQALVVPAKGGISRVFSDKIDSRRVSRIAAVLEKHLSLSFADRDIYVNVAGGIRLDETGIDLPLAFALYSARTDLPVPDNTVFAGEISLAGEIRSVGHIDRRFKAFNDAGKGMFLGPPLRGTGFKSDTGYKAAASIREGIGRVFKKP
ncbi:MAG: DNA repair protein RadA [Spirochaetales bacterium]|nr:DNA repair protein RadA [Spirochaetales bacterium]